MTYEEKLETIKEDDTIFAQFHWSEIGKASFVAGEDANDISQRCAYGLEVASMMSADCGMGEVFEMHLMGPQKNFSLFTISEGGSSPQYTILGMVYDGGTDPMSKLDEIRNL